MKRCMYKTVLATGALLLLQPLTTIAATTGDGGSSAASTGSVQGNQQRSFRDFDQNKDGYVSKSEAKDMSGVDKTWGTADTNRDGRLDQAEMSAYEQRQRTKSGGSTGATPAGGGAMDNNRATPRANGSGVTPGTGTATPSGTGMGATGTGTGSGAMGGSR